MSIKDKVLLAIYNEYQKDLPDMDKNITFDKLETNKEEFYYAFEKLENEGLINGAHYAKGAGNKIEMAFLNELKPSIRGIAYVEQRLLNA